jgi:hypothetical protein
VVPLYLPRQLIKNLAPFVSAPLMSSSVVTMPGDKLWMPTLLILANFNSASRDLPSCEERRGRAGQTAESGGGCCVPAYACCSAFSVHGVHTMAPVLAKITQHFDIVLASSASRDTDRLRRTTVKQQSHLTGSSHSYCPHARYLLQAALGCTIRCKAWRSVAVSACAIHVEHMATRRLVLHSSDGLRAAVQA